MAFLATYWWGFLIVTLVFSVAAMTFQARNMRRVVNAAKDFVRSPPNPQHPGNEIFPEIPTPMADALPNEINSFFARINWVAVCSLVASLSSILALIGIIIAAIDYFRAAS